MIEIKINAADSRQRADKYIARILPGASKSLIYKQIRKKNITLNRKKMTGGEILNTNDTIQFFFSDETFNKFKNNNDSINLTYIIGEAKKAYQKYKNIEIVYEDDNIICLNKPIEILSQKADGNELSLSEWVIGYLLNSGFVTEDSLKSFKPSVLNRLDKNTTGMILASKTFLGANIISELLRDRTLHKTYLTVVKGAFVESGIYSAYHHKDEQNNKVSIAASPDIFGPVSGISEIHTGIEIIKNYKHEKLGDISLLKIDLITGKSHQIRAHLAYLGYPVLGDSKYGDKILNSILREYNIRTQMLHSFLMTLPDSLPEDFKNLENMELKCMPPQFWRMINVDLEK